MLLVALPFAGGTGYAYDAIARQLEPGVEWLGVDLPGHGRRIRQPLLRTMPALAEDLLASLSGRLAAEPYSIFGHSMGAALGVVLTRRIRATGLPLPRCLIASGAPAPSVGVDKVRAGMTRDELIDELRQMGGAPEASFQHQALMDLMLPIMRADFEAIESFVYAPEPLPVPLAVLAGRGDPAASGSAEAWAAETSASFELHRMDGGHFFLLEDPLPTVGVLRDILGRLHGGVSATG